MKSNGFWGRAVERLTSVGTITLVLVLWEVLVRVFKVRQYLLPAPSAILQTMAQRWPLLVTHGLFTAEAVLYGFLLSALVAIPLGMAIVSSRPVELAVQPLILATQTIPKVAIGPILVLWLGFGILPKIVLSLLVAFFPVVVSTIVGLRSTEEEMIFLARSMGAGKLQTFLRFRLPRALPVIFGGLKVAMTMSVVGAIVGEFVGSDKGLGYLLLTANGNMDSRLLFACVFALSAIGIAFYSAVELIERLLLPWETAKADRWSSATM